MVDDEEFRYHVQRRSKIHPDWRNMTPDTGMSRTGAEKLHKEFTEGIREPNRHRVEFRLHPISKDELIDARSGDGARKGSNDNRRPVGERPKEHPINSNPYKSYNGRLPYRSDQPRKPVNDT